MTIELTISWNGWQKRQANFTTWWTFFPQKDADFSFRSFGLCRPKIYTNLCLFILIQLRCFDANKPHYNKIGLLPATGSSVSSHEKSSNHYTNPLKAAWLTIIIDEVKNVKSAFCLRLRLWRKRCDQAQTRNFINFVAYHFNDNSRFSVLCFKFHDFYHIFSLFDVKCKSKEV